MTVLDQVRSFFAGKGLTPAQVAGIAGNLQVESGFNPAALNQREQAIGLAQWEGPRRTALQAFARGRGTAETDAGTQLEFLWQELQTSERGAFSALRAATTVDQAATVFDQQFERSSGGARQARIAAARNILAGAWPSLNVPVGGWPAGSSQFAGASASGTAEAESNLPDWAQGILEWLANGALVLLGIIAVIIAVVLAAKSSDARQPVQLAPPAAGKGKPAPAAGAAEEVAAA